MKLDKAFITGADLLSAETVALGNIAGGDTALGEVPDEGAPHGSGDRRRVLRDRERSRAASSCTPGIGELSIPLSPDTLVFPRSVDQLPAALIDPAKRLLGLAWSIAKSPNGTPPAGLPQVGEQATRWRIDDMILAARHRDLGEDESTALSDSCSGG